MAGVISEILDFAQKADAYLHLSRSPLDALSILDRIRMSVYTRRLRSTHAELGAGTPFDEFLISAACCNSDIIEIGKLQLDISQVNIEVGLEFISSVSHCRIPFADHPPFYKTPDRYSDAIIDNPFVLAEVPAHLCRPEALSAAVSRAGLALGWIDIDSRTYELCVEAVGSFAEAIAMIPGFLIDKKIARAAMLGNPYFAVNHVPSELLTEDLLKEVVDRDPAFILVLDEALVTDELVIAALLGMPSLLLKLPRHLLTTRVYQVILEKHPELLVIIPAEALNREMIVGILQKRPELIRHVPPELRELGVCLELRAKGKDVQRLHIPMDVLSELDAIPISDDHDEFERIRIKRAPIQ